MCNHRRMLLEKEEHFIEQVTVVGVWFFFFRRICGTAFKTRDKFVPHFLNIKRQERIFIGKMGVKGSSPNLSKITELSYRNILEAFFFQ